STSLSGIGNSGQPCKNLRPPAGTMSQRPPASQRKSLPSEPGRGRRKRGSGMRSGRRPTKSNSGPRRLWGRSANASFAFGSGSTGERPTRVLPRRPQDFFRNKEYVSFMVTYIELRSDRKRLLALTGLTLPEFDLLVPAFARAQRTPVPARLD